MSTNKKCKLCNHQNIEAMECDYLSGLNDTEIATKYEVSDRTWRLHKSHSVRLNQEKSALKEVETALPSLGNPKLNSDELKLLSILTLAQSVERLNQIAASSGSVRAEATLGDNVVKLNQLMRGWNFERE